MPKSMNASLQVLIFIHYSSLDFASVHFSPYFSSLFLLSSQEFSYLSIFYGFFSSNFHLNSHDPFNRYVQLSLIFLTGCYFSKKNKGFCNSGAPFMLAYVLYERIKWGESGGIREWQEIEIATRHALRPKTFGQTKIRRCPYHIFYHFQFCSDPNFNFSSSSFALSYSPQNYHQSQSVSPKIS